MGKEASVVNLRITNMWMIKNKDVSRFIQLINENLIFDMNELVFFNSRPYFFIYRKENLEEEVEKF